VIDRSELLGQVRKKARKPSKGGLPPELPPGAELPPESLSPKSDPLLRERSEFWAFFGPGLAITLLGFILAYSFVGPPPPKRLRFAGGSSWGAYYKFAQRYRDVLARQGLQVEVLETQGSTENLQLLVQDKADIAFVQGGLTIDDPKVELEALGSVYFEPMWLFVRSKSIPRELDQLAGKRLAIGPSGSGTRAIALELLDDAGMSKEVRTFEVGGEKAEKMFLQGDLDAIFLVGGPTIPVVRRLLSTPGVQLMQFSRVHAMERRHEFLSMVPLYAGVIDMKGDIPPTDIQLLAPAATLVVRKGFHPALPAVILAAAREIHGGGDILSDHDVFPSPQYCSFPIATEARHFYQYGTSFVYRHLPFRWASALDRMAILLLPLIGLLVPIARLLPPAYSWTMKRKIYRRYRALQRLEARIGHASIEQLLGELDIMDEGAKSLASMPASYSADIYELRTHLDRVRVRLRRLDVDQKAKFEPSSASPVASTAPSPLPGPAAAQAVPVVARTAQPPSEIAEE
jgi:TRAP transporter TAXI family solute receptor